MNEILEIHTYVFLNVGFLTFSIGIPCSWVYNVHSTYVHTLHEYTDSFKTAVKFQR